jgi:hypothetical protein
MAYIVMLVEILITVGVLVVYCATAMWIHHTCDRKPDSNDPNNNLMYDDDGGCEYSLIE